MLVYDRGFDGFLPLLLTSLGFTLQGCELVLDELFYIFELIFQACEEGMVNVVGSVVKVKLIFMKIELFF